MSYTETHYVTQNGSGTRTGRTLANAWALSDFHNSANWSTYNSIDGKIGPGDVVYFSGVFTSRVIVTLGGNSSGSITLDGYEAGETDPVNTINTGTALLTQGIEFVTAGKALERLTVQDFRMTDPDSFRATLLVKGSSPSWTYKVNKMIIRRNYVYNSGERFLTFFFGDHNIIVDNHFYTFGLANDPGSSKFVQGALSLIEFSNSIFARNIVGHDGTPIQSSPGGSPELVHTHGCQNLLIEYNDLYGTPGQSGLRPKEHPAIRPSNYNHVIRFNKIHDNPNTTMGKGLYINTRPNEPVSHFYIYGNYIYNNGLIGLGLGEGVSEVHAWANILSENGRHGIVSYDTTNTSHHYYLYNNTIARNNRLNENDVARGGIVVTGGKNISIKNNLFWNNRPAGERSRVQVVSFIALDALEHNKYYHSMGDPYFYYNGGYRTLAYMQGIGFENASPAGSIIDPQFVSPSGNDGTYGTADDDYRLSAGSSLIDAGKTLTGSFSVDLSGGDAWFEAETGYSTLTFGYDDAIDPVLTDWTASIPAVVSAKQGSYGAGWEPGAYIYRAEEEDPEPPPEEPNAPSNFTFDPRGQLFGSDPLNLSSLSIKNLGVGDIETSEIVNISTPYGTKAWRLSNSTSGGRILYFDDAPADSYHIKTLVLYKASSATNSQIWPGGRIGAAVDATAGYFGGVRNSTLNRITKAVNGTFATQLDADHGLTAVENVWLFSLFEANEDVITVKTWAYGDTEPVSPQVSIVNDEIATGTAGAYLWLSGGETVDIAWIAVALEGDTLETPKVWNIKESGGDYASVALAIADVTFDDGDVIEISGTWTNPDTANIAFNGASTVTIRAIGDSRVNPENLSSPSHYRLITSNTNSAVQIENSSYTFFDGLDIRSSNTSDYVRCFNVYNSNHVITRNCVSGFTAQNNANQSVYRMETNNGSTCTGLIENCIAYNGGSSGVNPVVFNASSKTIMNVNSSTIYKCGVSSGGCLRGYTTTGNSVNFNVFNSILISVDGAACVAAGSYTTWDIHNCIADDTTITSMDAEAYGCLLSRTATANASPGAGDWVVFKSLSGLYNLLLQNVEENDALDMHTDVSGAGMAIPSIDIMGNSREADYDCGAFESQTGTINISGIITRSPYITTVSISTESATTIADIITGEPIIGAVAIASPSIPLFTIGDVISGSPTIGKPEINKPITNTPGNRTIKVPVIDNITIVPKLN